MINKGLNDLKKELLGTIKESEGLFKETELAFINSMEKLLHEEHTKKEQKDLITLIGTLLVQGKYLARTIDVAKETVKEIDFLIDEHNSENTLGKGLLCIDAEAIKEALHLVD